MSRPVRCRKTLLKAVCGLGREEIVSNTYGNGCASLKTLASSASLEALCCHAPIISRTTSRPRHLRRRGGVLGTMPVAPTRNSKVRPRQTLASLVRRRARGGASEQAGRASRAQHLPPWRLPRFFGADVQGSSRGRREINASRESTTERTGTSAGSSEKSRRENARSAEAGTGHISIACNGSFWWPGAVTFASGSGDDGFRTSHGMRWRRRPWRVQDRSWQGLVWPRHAVCASAIMLSASLLSLTLSSRPFWSLQAQPSQPHAWSAPPCADDALQVCAQELDMKPMQRKEREDCRTRCASSPRASTARASCATDASWRQPLDRHGASARW